MPRIDPRTTLEAKLIPMQIGSTVLPIAKTNCDNTRLAEAEHFASVRRRIVIPINPSTEYREIPV
jgi:hypothetical protein